jgi:hypothetical protein
MQSIPDLDFSILSSLLPAEIRGHIRIKDIAMKKLALLSAALTLGISSWAFAADNPPPPPEKGAQHQGKPPVKNGQHEGKQAQYNSKQPQRDGKQPQHDGKQPQHDGKQPQHNGKQPPKGSEHSGKPLPPKA